jgi:hypothetical protein
MARIEMVRGGLRGGLIALALLLLPVQVQAQLNGGNPNPGVIPLNKQYQELAAAWWQWVYSIPASENPLFDETGDNAAVGQPFVQGNIFFLAGVINVSGTAVREITIPTGTRLFFPILNVEVNNIEVDPPMTVEELRDLAASYVLATTELHASLDGEPLTDLFSYRAASPVFCFTLPEEDNIFQFFGVDVAGEICPVIADGFWLLLTPLPPGDHVINFGGTFGAPFDFTLDITYTVHVVPPGKQ